MGKNKHHDGPGPSQRQLRVGEVIRRALSEHLARGDVFDPDLAHVSITVGEVRTSPDLRVATVYVLPLGGTDTETVIDALNRNRREIRHILTKSIRLKYSPELRFMPDTSFDQMDATSRLLASEKVRQDLEGTPDKDDDPA